MSFRAVSFKVAAGFDENEVVRVAASIVCGAEKHEVKLISSEGFQSVTCIVEYKIYESRIVNQLIRKTAIVTGLSIMISMLTALSIPNMSAAGMQHGPAGPSPISGLAKNPRVPFQFGLGMQKFQEKCSACHGKWAEGTADKGPPLIHDYYKPSHHDDDSFFRAALSGVQAHHWHFGNMPPVEGITNQDIGQITQFIRWWQRENDIR